MTQLVDKAVWKFLSPLLIGWPLIADDQNTPRPDKKYATYGDDFLSAPQDDQEMAVNAQGIREVHGDRTNTVSVNFYGKGANEVAAALYTKLGLDTVIDTASTLGIELGIRQAPTDLTVLVEKQYEERALLEFQYNWISIVQEDTSFIDEVEFNSTVNGRDGTFNVPPGSG